MYGEIEMRLRKRLRKSTKQYIMVAVISFLILSIGYGTVILFSNKNLKQKYEEIVHSLAIEQQQFKHQIYVANTDLIAGEILQEEHLSLDITYTKQPENTFIDKEDIGKVVLIDLCKGTQILKPMLTKFPVSDDLREVKYNVIHISDHILTNDTVDIKICYPNGETYVIVSKKLIKNYETGMDCCCFWLTEKEQHRMAAAIVDAGLYQGTYLYLTKYVEPVLQVAAKPTYVPNIEVLSLMETDPNIVESCSLELNKQVRMALENRLATSNTNTVYDKNWDISSDYIYLEDKPEYIPEHKEVPDRQEKELTQVVLDELGGYEDIIEYGE